MGCIQLIVAVSFLALANAGVVIKKNVCNLVAVEGDPTAFINGVGSKPQYCADGTVFHIDVCGCVGVNQVFEKGFVQDRPAIFKPVDKRRIIDRFGPISVKKDFDRFGPIVVKKDFDPVGPIVIKKDFVCNLVAVEGDPTAFINGVGSKPQYCADGTVFHIDVCGCVGVDQVLEKGFVQDRDTIFESVGKRRIIDRFGPVAVKKDFDRFGPISVKKDFDPVGDIVLKKDFDRFGPIAVKKDIGRFDPIVKKRAFEVPRKEKIIVDKIIKKKDRIDCYEKEGRRFPIVDVCFAFSECIHGEQRFSDCEKGYSFDYASERCVVDSSCVSACPPQIQFDAKDVTKFFLGGDEIYCPTGLVFDYRYCVCVNPY